MTTPELIKAKEILDKILAVQPSYGPGEFPPTEQEQWMVSQKVYHKRMTIIYLALVEFGAEVRGEKL